MFRHKKEKRIVELNSEQLRLALYVLADYYGKGVGRKLMDAGLEHIKRFSQVCLWVLKENRRAIRFYEKCGFLPDGTEMTSPNISATEIRMILKR